MELYGSSLDDLELPENFITADAELPSISPRDKLSYMDDKKAWKEQMQYQENLAALNVLLSELETAILVAKPADIPAFIVDEFFNERNQINLRKEIEERVKRIT